MQTLAFQPAQAYMQPGSLMLCDAIAESGQTVPMEHMESGEQNSQKRRRHGGKRGGGTPLARNRPISNEDPSPMGCQASSSKYGSINFSEALGSAPQPKKKGRRQITLTKKQITHDKESVHGQPEPNAEHPGEPDDVGGDLERCNQIIEQIESGSSACMAFASLLPMAFKLAHTSYGSRAIQKAIEMVRTKDRSTLIEVLLTDEHLGESRLHSLLSSPHGNHVVAKIIEVMPPTSDTLTLIRDKLHGRMVDVARQQYGSRAVQRLLEHCSSQQMASLVQELLFDVEPLCRHPYGNFSVQHIFEHGCQVWKDKIVEQIRDDLPHLAMHRTASHVVQRALKFGGPDIQNTLVSILVCSEGEHSLVELGCSRYGSYVVDSLANILPWYDQVRPLLQDGLPRLIGSSHGKRVIEKFGLSPALSNLHTTLNSSKESDFA
jgi:hypothetical protein